MAVERRSCGCLVKDGRVIAYCGVEHTHPRPVPLHVPRRSPRQVAGPPAMDPERRTPRARDLRQGGTQPAAFHGATAWGPVQGRVTPWLSWG